VATDEEIRTKLATTPAPFCISAEPAVTGEISCEVTAPMCQPRKIDPEIELAFERSRTRTA
jgi:hypothetical protein